MISKSIRALVLFSGGLDSILAAKLLQEQKIEVLGLTFVSYFFNAQIGQKSAEAINLDLKIIDISVQHLAMVKKPLYGYGSALNPCIDCHLMMLKKAKEIMKKEKYDLVATGEVLGERPMSQNKKALDLLEKESGLSGYLLRPLSARLLKPAVLEKKELINRNKLLDISGRSRQKQMALAKKYKIDQYPQPAGGCLLTDIYFGQKLKGLFDKWPDCSGQDVLLLKLGRLFWHKDNIIIAGRNHKENLALKNLLINKDIFIESKKFPGPSILIRPKSKIYPESLVMAKELIIKYSSKLKKIQL